MYTNGEVTFRGRPFPLDLVDGESHVVYIFVEFLCMEIQSHAAACVDTAAGLRAYRHFPFAGDMVYRYSVEDTMALHLLDFVLGISDTADCVFHCDVFGERVPKNIACGQNMVLQFVFRDRSGFGFQPEIPDAL